MADNVYRIEIDVNGAPSGSEQLARQQGDVLPSDQDRAVRPQPRQKQQPIEEQLLGERFKTIKKVGVAGIGAGKVALDFYQQNRSFAGDSNRNLRINETMRKVNILTVAGGLVATGNLLGAGLYVGYTALNIAKENKELINQVKIDTYQSQYYTNRLVKDRTQRSR